MIYLHTSALANITLAVIITIHAYNFGSQASSLRLPTLLFPLFWEQASHYSGTSYYSSHLLYPLFSGHCCRTVQCFQIFLGKLYFDVSVLRITRSLHLVVKPLYLLWGGIFLWSVSTVASNLQGQWFDFHLGSVESACSPYTWWVSSRYTG